MRALAIALLLSVLAAPALGQGTPHRRECIRMTKQIARYAGDVERARERDNELWERATLDQIDRLAARRARLCPQYARDDGALRRFGQLLGTAAKLAARYFTMGAL